MVQQGSLFDDIPEARFWQGIVKTARKSAKQKLPYRLENETKEEYDQNLHDEIRLEIAYRLRQLADEIERTTLKRQNDAIALIWNTKNAIE